MEVLLIVTLVDGIFTVTLQVAVFPLIVFTVITALPFSTPVTTPEEDTFATFVFELLHFRLSVLSLGYIVPFRVYVFPLFKETEVLLKDTFVEGTFTVTLQEAVFPLVVFAVIVAVPFATPVTTPLDDTFATFVFDEVHVTESVLLDGVKSGTRVYVFPV